MPQADPKTRLGGIHERSRNQFLLRSRPHRRPERLLLRRLPGDGSPLAQAGHALPQAPGAVCAGEEQAVSFQSRFAPMAWMEDPRPWDDEPAPTAVDLALEEIENGLTLKEYCRRVNDTDLRQWAELLAEFGSK